MNATYSSFIGNVLYDFYDPCNASLEIAKRGYEVIVLKNKKFYPDFNLALLKNQWKEELKDGVKDWKEFFSQIKNSGLMCRVQLKDIKNFSCLSLSSKKSCVKIYKFYPGLLKLS